MPILFPYSAYPSQQLYMEKVIEACQSSTHALLESPTGTGKTAALLCSVLAWTAKEVQRMTAQLAQLMAEGGGAAAAPGIASLSTLQQHQQMMADIVRRSAGPAASPSDPASLPSLPRLPSTSSAASAVFSPSPAFTRPRIIYSSRTHSQLSKVISELKRTAYRPRMTLLGSRQQLCVHPDVRGLSGLAQNHACHSLVNAHDCVFYENLASAVAGRKSGAPLGLAMDSCMDLEDLLRYGEDHRMCPYFSTREVLGEAELVLMPYNYLIDASIREKLQLSLQGAVVVFDEAHNLESVCVDAASFDLSSLDVAAAIAEVDRCKDESVAAAEQRQQQDAHDPWSERHSAPSDIPDVASLLILKQLLLEVEAAIDSHDIRDLDKGETRNGEYIFELLERCRITPATKEPLLALLDEAVEFLLKCDDAALSAGRGRRTSSALAKLASMFRLVYAGGAEKCKEVARDYRVHIHQKAGRRKGWAGGGGGAVGGAPHKKAAPMPSYSGGGRGGIFQHAHKPTFSSARDGFLDDEDEAAASASSSYRVLSYWCFNPGLSMATLSACGVRTFVFTSGTLSPLDSFAAEFQLPFPVRLENAHIIQPHQILLSVLERGPSGNALLSSYANRGNTAYVSDLGSAIVNVCRVVPDGVLIFFPSYFALEGCRDEWERGGVMARIRTLKHVVYEPRTSGEFNAAIAEYQHAIERARKEGRAAGAVTGAIFFAVCRGKVSEGLDFADANGRAVIITGLPFPALHEPKVRIKREFLDQQRSVAAQSSSSSPSSSSSSSPHAIPMLTGNMWYQQQASRAVNQAIGRVIRHAHDYGAILLCDERFASVHQQQQLSAWVRGRITTHKAFGSVIQPLRSFFKRLEAEDLARNPPTVLQPASTSNGPEAVGDKRRDPAQGDEGWRRKRRSTDPSIIQSAQSLVNGLVGEDSALRAGRTDPSSSPVSFKQTASRVGSGNRSLVTEVEAQRQRQ